MPPHTSAESIITCNLTTYSGSYNLGFYRDCIKQGHKIALSIQNFDHFKSGETFDGEQRKYLVAGVERSGHLHSTMAEHLTGTGIRAYNYKEPDAPRFRPGYCLNELSSSGAKKEGISRMWAAGKDGTLLTVTTSDLTSPLSMIVRGQKTGINIDWEEIDKKYPEGSSNELEGFRPGKNFKSPIDFEKTYPWVENTEDLVIEIPDRKRCLGLLLDKGVAYAGNLTECMGDWLNKLRVITYQSCKKKLKEENVVETFNRILDESGKELRGSFSQVLDQKDKLATICEDTFDKEYMYFIAIGGDSGKKAQASQMRGEHAKMENVIYIKSENEPTVRNMIESSSPDYLKNNVRAIAFSESLQTHSKDLIEFLQSKGITVYGVTANKESEIVKQNPERWVVMENQTVHTLESEHSPAKIRVSSFQFGLQPVADCITSYWIVENGSDVYSRHKTHE